MKTGVILLSHGSRSPEAQITLRNLRAQVLQSGVYENVKGASLQFNQPDLPTAISEMVMEGINRIIVVPLFIYQGLHMKRDIPEIVALEKTRHPGVEIVITGNIGADRRLAEIIVEKIKEAG